MIENSYNYGDLFRKRCLSPFFVYLFCIYFEIILLTTIIKTRRINVGIIDNIKNKPLKHPLPQVSPSYNIINATAKGNRDIIIKNTPKVIFLSK